MVAAHSYQETRFSCRFLCDKDLSRDSRLPEEGRQTSSGAPVPTMPWRKQILRKRSREVQRQEDRQRSAGLLGEVFGFFLHFSEAEAAAELNQARQVLLSTDLPEQFPIVDAGVGRSKLCPVGEIEDLGPQFNPVPLSDRNSLHRREVTRVEALGAQVGIDARLIAEGPC